MKHRLETEAIKDLIELGMIKYFPDIFTKYGFAPTPLARSLGKNTASSDLFTKTPELLTDLEKLLIAQFFGVDAKAIFSLIERSTLQREDEILKRYFAQRKEKQRKIALRKATATNNGLAG
jgi:hypothetical protein